MNEYALRFNVFFHSPWINFVFTNGRSVILFGRGQESMVRILVTFNFFSSFTSQAAAKLPAKNKTSYYNKST